jgi:L-asparaginase
MPSPAPEQPDPSTAAALAEDTHVLLIATGGTIAGQADSAAAGVGYRSAERSAAQLIAAVPALAGVPLRTLQLAQVDSKDMGPALWQALARAVQAALQDAAVQGVVITHGTDTLEETAYVLHRVLAAPKPVVLTAAMRPATALDADGPRNLLDAVTLARCPGARGVLVVMAGRVHAADAVRKHDAWRIDAFASAPGGPVALVEEGQVRALAPWPQPPAQALLGLARLARPAPQWPRVAWITSHAGFDAALVDAAVAAGFDGLLLAGTGNGSLHAALEAAALRAQAAGVVVHLSTRCASGRVVARDQPESGSTDAPFPVSPAGSAAQARVELLLALLGRG